MIEPALILLILLVVLLLDLVTIAAREALLHTSLPRLLNQRETGGENVDHTIRLIQSLPRLQASLSLARLVWRFLAAGLVLVGIVNLNPETSWFTWLASLLVGALILFWLEWVVQIAILRDPVAWALRLTTFSRALMVLFAPVIGLTLFLSGDIPVVPDATGVLVTEDDLRTMVEAGQQEGFLEQEERKMIFSIFELGNTLAREIMVPRIDILALDVMTQIPDAIDALLQSGYSRAPVYQETVDNVLGLLYAKDLLRVWRMGNEAETLHELLRPAYFIPEAKKVDTLLAEMQSQRIHMAIVVDEYGGVAGLVTLEDIVEEILGEIQDEYDEAEESPYEPLTDGGYIFLGRIDLDDFNEIVNANLPKDEADTLGGLIYSRMGRVPTNGESVLVDNLELTVEQVVGRRIRKVRVQWQPDIREEEGNGDRVNG